MLNCPPFFHPLKAPLLRQLSFIIFPHTTNLTSSTSSSLAKQTSLLKWKWKINKIQKGKQRALRRNYRKKRLCVVFNLHLRCFRNLRMDQTIELEAFSACRNVFSPWIGSAKLLFIFCCLGAFWIFFTRWNVTFFATLHSVFTLSLFLDLLSTQLDGFYAVIKLLSHAMKRYLWGDIIFSTKFFQCSMPRRWGRCKATLMEVNCCLSFYFEWNVNDAA